VDAEAQKAEDMEVEEANNGKDKSQEVVRERQQKNFQEMNLSSNKFSP
jgi:hypothetical protein